MLRRILALMMTLLMLPILSLADEVSPYEVFTFSSSLPERLKEPLSVFVPDETKIISGAAIQHNGYHYSDSPSSLDSYTAMVLVKTDDGPHLYAAAWVENLPWQVNDYSRFLRQQKNVYVSIYKPDTNHAPVFSVDYSVQGGIKSDLFCFFSNKLWCIDGHIDLGRRLTVMSTYPESIKMTDSSGSKDYTCSMPFYLDYMADISAFPDASNVGSYALDALTWANGVGLIKGQSSGGVSILAPKNDATREEVAVVISRFCTAE